ncbi:uncharacterized protein BDR25DRAFT_367005 [Lindgomyces ingoldianus]|uniref:Uncharacterized protein n=1 Tax=Lindgomyces ingoldianus TaxID=673940 RepID=A0ACB6QZ78_9PLEO|nr:uncharacterized protein BDR25DRAFT_367005 [Lindgomyces ingoldianus]KAF2472211.1 hypothetical protein BDR25DRAFT_367005 [Lindgomyces ingoldianus]
MDLQTPSSTAAFNKLPIELNKQIVHYLDTDRDICSFRLICKNTNHAVDGDNLSFWRSRFRDAFAMKPGSSNNVLKKQYQRRKRYLRLGAGVDFYRGWTKQEQKVLRVLRDLIVESFQGPYGLDEYGRPFCLNQQQLVKFVKNSKTFLDIKRLRKRKNAEDDEKPYTSPALAAIQLMCAHFLFGQEQTHNIYCFEVSQKAVYDTAADRPLYGGYNNLEVNMEWFLHCLNFFKYHMVSKSMQSFHAIMDALDVTQKPSHWQAQLVDGCYPLSKHWKGTYAFLDAPELQELRNSSYDADEDDVFIDGNMEGDGKIQTLLLECVESGKFNWPTIFEKHLQSKPRMKCRRTRAQQRSMSPSDAEAVSIHFTGQGDDAEEHFFASGWLNPLPAQPRGIEIPGWQRITFMKYFIDDDHQYAEDNLWAYEGVVLPGGRMILGRWWLVPEVADSAQSNYSGPFIFWAVGPEPDLDLDSSDE